MSLTLIDRLQPQLRRKQQVAIDAGQLIKRSEMDLLDPQQLRPMALFSLVLFFVSAIFFVIFNLLAYSWSQPHQSFTISIKLATAGSALLWVLINVVSYIAMLLVHEGVHALVILLWGGKPHFGAKLPLVVYCGAREQVFRRNQYLAIALAPFVIITAAAIVLTIIAPVFASYILFGSIGNFAGAAGDLIVSARLLREPASVLVEDTETGYSVWTIEK